MCVEGRNSGGPSNQQDPHGRSPPDMPADDQPDDQTHDQSQQRSHMNHVTQLQPTPTADKDISPQGIKIFIIIKAYYSL